MSHEARLPRGSLEGEPLIATPVARLRIELTTMQASGVAYTGHTHPNRRRADSPGPDDPEEDGLRPARGLLAGALLGAGLWAVIIFLAWLIFR